MTSPLVLLASASPRRAALLDEQGVSFRACPTEVDESPHPGETPRQYVVRIAREKARTGWVQRGQERVALGADTTLSLDGRILGKPADRDEFLGMMSLLSGRAHLVLTAVCLVGEEVERQSVVSTRVWFRRIARRERDWYWRTGEPGDKAGGYAIQGLGARFVKRIDGSYSAVVGLPVCETLRMLAAAGVESMGSGKK